MTAGGRRALAALLAAATAGCVSRAELIQRDQQLVRFMREQRRQVEAVQREVERLRGDVEGGTARPRGDGSTLEDRVAALERRVYQSGLPADTPTPLEPEAGVPVDVGEPAPGAGASVAAAPRPPETDLMASWTDEVQQEIQSAQASDAAGRDAYVEAMQGLASKDCGPAVARLDAFAQTHRDSSLADNALYWAARCYVLMGDATPGRSTEFYNQAISKFYDVGTSYPKGEKTPAALLEQGDLFIRIGDVPDARIVFSRLIRDYPGSQEAGAARQKLVDLGT